MRNDRFVRQNAWDKKCGNRMKITQAREHAQQSSQKRQKTPKTRLETEKGTKIKTNSHRQTDWKKRFCHSVRNCAYLNALERAHWHTLTHSLTVFVKHKLYFALSLSLSLSDSASNFYKNMQKLNGRFAFADKAEIILLLAQHLYI